MGIVENVKGIVEDTIDTLNPLSGGKDDQAKEGEGEKDQARASSEAKRDYPAATSISETEAARVQRSEEELRAGVRQTEAGSVGVEKTVSSETEQVSVPTRHEQVHVDRYAVEGGVSPEAEIGEEEIRVPIVEEEMVVEKRPVVKEEVVIRKDVSTDIETAEAEVRKERVHIEDNRPVS